MKRHISHGEVNLFEVDSIPETAKKIIPTEDQLVNGGFKIANSETTGNHHFVRINDQVEFFEDSDGTLYIRNLKPTTVECVDVSRHGTVKMPPTVWKRKISREVDHLTNSLRQVAD